MNKIFRTMNLYISIHKPLYPTLKNPRFLTPLLHFHGSNNKITPSDSELEFEFEFDEIGNRSSKPISQNFQISKEELEARELRVRIELWPEWMDFMECLSKKGYFEKEKRSVLNAELGSKELNHIRTASLNFARDRSKLIGHLSMKELQMVAGCGCPSIDRKVVNSGKRLRAHVGIDERNVCSSCNFRGECERAFVKARGDEGGRTVDIMRMLLFYGFDHIAAMAENRHCLNDKANGSVRRLLKEIVEYSSGEYESDLQKSNEDTSAENPSDQRENHDTDSLKPGDWQCSKCNFLNFSRNVKCLRCGSLFIERLKKLHEDQADLPLKKGDWICDKCNFLNFAKNSRCLQCKEKPSNRQLNPGEWECESCNYINFRKNMLCLKCDYRRPKSRNTPDITARPVVENGNYSFSTPGSSSDKTGGNANLWNTRRKNDTSLWRFVENDDEESEDHDDFKDSRFPDFPTFENKRNSSQIAERQERWKLEMLERRKGMADAMEKEDDLILRSNNIERRLESVESTDDDDECIAEWFGYRKPGSER